MAGKKGMKHYSAKFKAEVLNQIDSGAISLRQFSREKGIDRSVIQQWRRIENGTVMNLPKKRGRPRSKPLTKLEELTAENRQLKMDN